MQDLIWIRRASERSFTCDKEAVRAMLDKDVTARGSNISGGLAQSVALARVFVRTKARLVIIDESLEQMDSWKKRKIIFPQLFDYIEKHDMTLILVSHDMVNFSGNRGFSCLDTYDFLLCL